MSFFSQEFYVAVVRDSSRGDIVGYIPLLPNERLLEDIFSIYEKQDFATMVILYVRPLYVISGIILGNLRKYCAKLTFFFFLFKMNVCFKIPARVRGL